ncbi:MAG: hypothetical protein WKF96_22765 [Solirubrobacteraceae bacterium]
MAFLVVSSSPAMASSRSSGSLSYAGSTTTTAGMLDVGMVFNTVAAEMPGTIRGYTAQFHSVYTGTQSGIISVVLGQSPQPGQAPLREIRAYVPSSNIVNVTPGAGVTSYPATAPPSTVTGFVTGGGAWTPGRTYRLRTRQIARPSGGRRFRVSVTNVVTGGERVIVDFTRMTLDALSLGAVANVSAQNESTCASLYDARASIDRPVGVRGSDGATVVATPSPLFYAGPAASYNCPASQRRISTDRIVIDVGR